jgi:dTDP-4-dehydrorhamnose 3,5-epimerase-like enzyme
MQVQEQVRGAYVFCHPFLRIKGFFFPVVCEDEFRDRGLNKSFVQCNHSGSEGMAP